ncbi:MAG: hypothetical protein ABIW33_02235 [Sphingomicrobium sp.]
MEVEVEKPHVKHHSSGVKWFDLSLGLLALFISFISIFIAWHHSEIMRELVHQNELLVEAESLPYVQLSASARTGGGAALNAVNEGVGPARIVTAEVSVDGKPVGTIDELAQACCGASARADFAASSLEGRMVRPGDTVPYIEISGASALQSRRIATTLCYCSVFDDCWTAVSHDPTPNPVKSCVVPAHPYRE